MHNNVTNIEKKQERAQHVNKSYSSLLSFLSVIFFLGFALPLLGADSVVQWMPQWKVGDQYAVEHIKERETGKVIYKSKVLIDIQVKEKGEDYFILHCTYGACEFNGFYGKNEIKNFQKFVPDVERMTKMVEGMCLKIKTGSDGLPIELMSVDEAMKMMNDTMDTIETIQKKNNRPKDDVNQSIATTRDFFEKNQELMSNLILNELAPFFLFCGAELVQGKASEYDELLPNPFGGEPFPAKGSILLKEFDEQTGIAAIEYKLTADDDKLGQMMVESLNKLSPQNPIPKESEKMQIRFSDKSLYKIDSKKGWAVSVESERNISGTGNGSTKQEVRRFRFKTLEKTK